MAIDQGSILSILPPLIAIVLAIWTRQVFLSLLAGIFLGWTVLTAWNPFKGFLKTMDAFVHVFRDGGNTKVILFCGFVGSLLLIIQKTGGIEGFLRWLKKRNWGYKKRGAQLFSALLGVAIFIETSISCLLVGTVARPLFDQLNISRAKLAYICDSTSSPINILIPLNAWGAFIVGMLGQEKVTAPLEVMVRAIPLNFYAILTLGLVFIVILSGKDWGPMKGAENRTSPNHTPASGEDLTAVAMKPGIKPGLQNMLLPILSLILLVPLFLFISGGGNMAKGSGSTAVYWGVLGALGITALFAWGRKLLSLKEISELVLKGVSGMVPLMLLMVLAFALGDVTRELHTGAYVSQLALKIVSPKLLPFILFLSSCFIAFSTGTSWGTFAIMIPLATSVTLHAGIALPLGVAAVLGGGLFGDHCSPISDTTIVASMASACDHVEHVRTQLPYALVAACAAAVMYLVIPWI